MITAITCTGDRPICLELLQKWIKQQTVKPDQWIIVDDGQEQTIPDLNICEYIRRKPARIDPKHTLLINIVEAYKYVKGDIILFLEDDEYYSPDYIKTMSNLLQNFDIVGIGRSKYYYLPTQKWYKHQNMGHASLAQTAFNRNFFDQAKQCLEGDSFYDIRLWEKINKNAARFTLPLLIKEYSNNRGYIFEDYAKSLYVGMKGMPGRTGIGSGHQDSVAFTRDKDFETLIKWCPNDFIDYINLK